MHQIGDHLSSDRLIQPISGYPWCPEPSSQYNTVIVSMALHGAMLWLKG